MLAPLLAPPPPPATELANEVWRTPPADDELLTIDDVGGGGGGGVDAALANIFVGVGVVLLFADFLVPSWAPQSGHHRDDTAWRTRNERTRRLEKIRSFLFFSFLFLVSVSLFLCQRKTAETQRSTCFRAQTRSCPLSMLPILSAVAINQLKLPPPPTENADATSKRYACLRYPAVFCLFLQYRWYAHLGKKN